MPSFSSTGSSLFSIPFAPWRRRQSYEMNSPDAEFSGVYLGNVLTLLAKGDDSIEKPLSVIWRAYNAKKVMQNRRGASSAMGDIAMKLRVTRSGLKAETKQLGVSDYWAHRITFCAAPANYPRVFCWVYKHEGKRMKPDLRCHAILCRKATDPKMIADDLKIRLRTALLEYKREKLSMERARKYSTCTTGGLLPRRRAMLQTGTLHFRPPVSRSRSVPRLNSIDEEEEPKEEETNEFERFCEEMGEDQFAQGSDTDSISYNYRNTPVLDGDETSITTSPEEDNKSSGASSSSSTRSKRSSSDGGGSTSNDSGLVADDPYFSGANSDEGMLSYCQSRRISEPTTGGSNIPAATNPAFTLTAPPVPLARAFQEYLVV